VLSPPIDDVEVEPVEAGAPPSSKKSRWSKARVHRRRRRILAVVLAAFGVFFLWFAISLGSALTNPALGSSMGARAAEWFREHGGASIVVWAENAWYSHHQPKVGGALAPGTIRKPKVVHSTAVAAAVPHLPAPAPIVPLASPPVAGEGQWSPAGRQVKGVPAIYETMLRPSAIHTSYVVGVAWMDPKLLKATLYSGSQIPGGGPYSHTAPISTNDATSVDAAFNAGFLMSDSNGGYYTDNKTVVPLRTGAASFVVYKNGSFTVGQWGRDATMGPDVTSVRQNLDLLVDNGQVVPAAYSPNSTLWGKTLGGGLYVWRSGIGVTANGALVYVGGPGLDIADLATILVRAGAVRAMELDINTDWVNYSTYQPSTPGGAATPANGTELLSGMTGTPGRYFQSWWARDFITMSAVAP
jgi:Phosphodiester glycosidase